MKIGLKHLIKCRCILPQFQSRRDPVFHQFVVFSVLEDDKLIEHYAQCTNCGIIHHVTDVNVSTFSSKEAMTALITIDDIKSMLSEKLIMVLEKNDVDLPTWQAAQFITENEKWGDWIILSTENEGDRTIGKILRILGPSLLKIENFEKQNAF